MIETQRLAIETRTFAAQETRVTREGRRLRMDEAKILATVESDTFKYTGVPRGTWDDLVVLTLRGGLDSAAITQSRDTCIDTICRMRMDTKSEAGQSELYTTTVSTDFGTHWFTSRMAE